MFSEKRWTCTAFYLCDNSSSNGRAHISQHEPPQFFIVLIELQSHRPLCLNLHHCVLSFTQTPAQHQHYADNESWAKTHFWTIIKGIVHSKMILKSGKWLQTPLVLVSMPITNFENGRQFYFNNYYNINIVFINIIEKIFNKLCVNTNIFIILN